MSAPSCDDRVTSQALITAAKLHRHSVASVSCHDQAAVIGLPAARAETGAEGSVDMPAGVHSDLSLTPEAAVAGRPDVL
jgi:hypothetical protein